MPNPRDYSYTRKMDCENWNYIINKVSTSSLVYSVGSRTSTDYGRRKPAGKWVNPTSYSMTMQRRVAPYGSTDISQGSQLVSWSRGNLGDYGTLNTDTATYDAFPSDLANRALVKARAKLKATDVNLGQAFGERRQTAQLVATNLNRVARDILSLRKPPYHLSRPWEWLHKQMRHLPEHVLEVVYGWKPLLSDIHGAIDALDKRDRNDWIVTVKASASSKGKIDIKRRGTGSLDFYDVSGSYFHGCFVRIDAVPSNGALATASSLGLVNPLSLAWELTPFSFVADWALPIGPWLDSLDAVAGWDVRGYSSSNFTKIRTRTVGVSHVMPSNPSQYCRSNWRASRDLTRLNRTASQSVPLPAFPTPKDPTSKQHALNAIALVGALLRGSQLPRY